MCIFSYLCFCNYNYKIFKNGIKINKMVLPILPGIIVLAGARILVSYGTHLLRFIAANPKILLSTATVATVADALKEHEKNEQIRNSILQDIYTQNPELAQKIVSAGGFSFHPVENMFQIAISSAITGLIIYAIIQKI